MSEFRRREVWIGHDERSPLAYNTMRYSVEANASKPISVRGLFINQLPISRVGATAFTYSRFLVPWLMDYQGLGLFCDEDQVMVGDVWELFSLTKRFDEDWDVAVVPHTKFLYERPAVMLYNNQRLKHMTPEFVQDKTNRLFDFAWAKKIVDIPPEWNYLCGMDEPRTDAKLYHFSQGFPYWQETRGLPDDHVWFEAMERMVFTKPWIDFHKDTIHFKPVLRRFLQPYGLKIGQGPDYPPIS